MNNYCCLAKSFAQAYGVELDYIFKLTGYKGDEILWPDLPEPGNHRGHHVQEMIDIGLRLGYTVTEIQARPALGSYDRVHILDVGAKRFEYYLTNYNGVVIGTNQRGNRHAIYWNRDGQLPINDPVVMYIVK